ncbi:MAG: TIGR04282 family arsenosugar biosynthesis glycosyltransferase, partial [Dermatophilaceae bacterium]
GTVLVVAKAPRPGEVKTRLIPAVDPATAADLAAAALLDTLDAAAESFPPTRRVLALTGDLAGACREPELRAAVGDWIVVGQHGTTLSERLAHAHRQAHGLARGPVVQIGMDTPHVDPGLLASLPELARRSGRPVLGPADDGGWWVLVTRTAHQADVLAGVPTSRPDTGRLTTAALAAAGIPACLTATLRDVDLAADAEAVAALAPHTRFARAWCAAVNASLPARSLR